LQYVFRVCLNFFAQTSISLCVRFSLFYMPLKGSGITMIGSWNGPLVFELRDFQDYPYSIFRLNWNLNDETQRYAGIGLEYGTKILLHFF
jgi:hypothetical protein